jgi:hypothetical protein
MPCQVEFHIPPSLHKSKIPLKTGRRGQGMSPILQSVELTLNPSLEKRGTYLRFPPKKFFFSRLSSAIFVQKKNIEKFNFSLSKADRISVTKRR